MTSYFSATFICGLLPLTIVVYAVLPKRFRWIVLLCASYVFFWCLSSALIVFILASTLSIYACGRGMAAMMGRRDTRIAEAKANGVKINKRELKKDCKRHMRYVLAAGILINMLFLVALKYLVFFGNAASSLLSLLGIDFEIVAPQIGMPIGISFYTLMAVSYLVDVYRETVSADRNLGRLALFLSFFPQIMEGPICRYGQTAADLYAGEPIRRQNLYEGSLRMLFGLCKKFIVADRLNAFVEPVFDNYAAYDGGVLALAAVFYTIQLYCDFSGTMDVVIGMARIFNVKLPENFRQPFFSRTASEFWMRWHITLGTWFKDYVYYPVSLSKPCKNLTSSARKKFGNRYGPLLASAVALLCVWFGNGLWHGAGSQYIFFGLYYFVLIMAGGLVEPIAQDLSERFGINRDSIGYRVFQSVRTLLVIFTGELFFRANGLHAGLDMFSTIVSGFTLDSFLQGTIFSIGIDAQDILIVTFMMVFLLVIGIIKEQGCDICPTIGAKGTLVRWGAWIALVLLIVIFGAYGPNYTPVDPMYAQF